MKKKSKFWNKGKWLVVERGVDGNEDIVLGPYGTQKSAGIAGKKAMLEFWKDTGCSNEQYYVVQIASKIRVSRAEPEIVIEE